MSSTTLPISPAAFRAALTSLPLPQLYAKAAELHNSIFHLHSSNIQLHPLAFPQDQHHQADQDCADAIRENELVVQRMQERLAMLREEVEGRGARWVGFAPGAEGVEGGKEGGVGVVDGSGTGTGEMVNGVGGDAEHGRGAGRADVRSGRETAGQMQGSGRLTDEELRQRLLERLGEPGDQEDEGMHL